jgi:fatty acid desaturase
MLHPLIVPPLVFVRFLFFTPLAWTIPGFRRFVHKRCSSMIIDPTYCRQLSAPAAERMFYLQEFFCFLWLLAIVTIVAVTKHTLPWPFFIQSYTTAVIILTLNALRTLGAHNWENDLGQMSFEEQLLDSVNYPQNPVIGELWAPVGLRYHALHHLFPSIPYHNLGIAHRRLTKQLPADSLYHNTSQTTLTRQLVDLWKRAKKSTQNEH